MLFLTYLLTSAIHASAGRIYTTEEFIHASSHAQDISGENTAKYDHGGSRVHRTHAGSPATSMLEGRHTSRTRGGTGMIGGIIGGVVVLGIIIVVVVRRRSAAAKLKEAQATPGAQATSAAKALAPEVPAPAPATAPWPAPAAAPSPEPAPWLPAQAEEPWPEPAAEEPTPIQDRYDEVYEEEAQESFDPYREDPGEMTAFMSLGPEASVPGGVGVVPPKVVFVRSGADAGPGQVIRTGVEETDVIEWFQNVLGETKGDQQLFDWLMNGQVLCRFINKIQPGIVPKINKTDGNNEGKTKTQSMENISMFINACRNLGVHEAYLLGPNDLREETKNMKAVFTCINNLGCTSRTTAPSFPGPWIGVAQHVAQKR